MKKRKLSKQSDFHFFADKKICHPSQCISATKAFAIKVLANTKFSNKMGVL